VISVLWQPTRRPRRTSVTLTAFALGLAVLASSARLDSQSAPPRILAIGDIHGSYDGLTTILRRTGVVDDKLKWSGGRTIVVQTGDYTDRGTEVKKVMDLLMQLEREARSAGGQFIVLAGNHEIMNVIGDFRDVTPEICATFATADSVKRRDQAWTQYERLAQSRAKATTPPAPVYSKTRDAWLTDLPPGCLEYREAMGPNGTYGRWLRAKDVAAVVGDTLFMHAGLNPSRPAPKSIDDVNEAVRAETRRLDAFRRRLTDQRLALPSFDFQDMIGAAVVELQVASAAIAAAKAEGKEMPALDVPLLREAQEIATNIAKWAVVEPEGPLWFRGYATWPEDSTAAQVGTFLDSLKLARIVVGHTPTADRRIASRYGSRVTVIDTGMLTSYYKGNASALEIVGPRMKAIYADGEVELTPKTAARLAPGREPSNAHAINPVALATAKLTPLRLRSGGTPGIGRGYPDARTITDPPLSRSTSH
jgi:hypothetical protein